MRSPNIGLDLGSACAASSGTARLGLHSSLCGTFMVHWRQSRWNLESVGPARRLATLEQRVQVLHDAMGAGADDMGPVLYLGCRASILETDLLNFLQDSESSEADGM